MPGSIGLFTSKTMMAGTDMLQIAVKVVRLLSNIKCRTGIWIWISLAKTHMGLEAYHPTFHKMHSPPVSSDVCLQEEMYDAPYIYSPVTPGIDWF